MMDKAEKSVWKIPWKGILVALALSIAALALVFSRVARPQEILNELEMYPLGYFLAALFFVLVAWIVDGQRIGMLTRALGHKIPWWELTIALGAANFLTLVTPFAGGGGALIVYFLYRRGMKVSAATSLVLAGGLAGQIGLAFLGLIVFSSVRAAPAHLTQYFDYLKIGALFYIVVLFILLFLVTRNERFFQWLFRKSGPQSKSAAWLGEFRATFQILLAEKRAHYASCLVVAFCYYVVYYLGGFLLLGGFGVFSPWLRYALSVLFGIAPVFSPIPGAAGASEFIAYVVLEEALPLDALGTFIVLWRTVIFYIPILLGGSVFAVLAFRWATAKHPVDILPAQDDHTR